MSEPPRFNRGERVIVHYDGGTATAEIGVRSGNGRAIAIVFDGMIEGYAGVMPLMWNGTAFENVFDGIIIRIERIAHA
jgi:hypothetical protein